MIFVALGGFFGAIARYGLSQFIQSIFNTAYPIATFLINSLGSFLIGFAVGQGFSTSVHLFAVIGFLGAFTTFSTFSFDIIQLLEKNEVKRALLYLISSVLLGILFAMIGFQLSN
ncbi:fluoride efflux transporter CrcB [Solibacillus sp. FSL K6-1523]|uniref:fluoride efflux transporter CrcB n=1 Tax=Solibacillus sp. FSL K6-1523 TaxID=2921471 RepID=UPI0030F58839